MKATEREGEQNRKIEVRDDMKRRGYRIHKNIVEFCAKNNSFYSKTTSVFFPYKLPFSRNKEKGSYNDTTHRSFYLPRLEIYAGFR